ncbi:SIMPL domain-containing protein [Paeniglutamicibacter sp. ABSL32-1]|uniref:SIMPL domain-containing protein n=1 Tax=Paeniglutamicibacter quisquiliarum TaxID=2849498 RepID=UPI001C2DA763|nr:SIMPL domain-containing protein [Paeniglutamicibacter quisquiliarum]MBV1780885.1 SIMPL domain-containing protein [Paeniglutamicibacter quisquiliarum]
MNRPAAITVHGTASAPAVPDVMAISLTIHLHHGQAAEAFDLAAVRAREVIAAVLVAAPGANLATTGIGLMARTSWRNEESVADGYDAETTIEARELAVDAVTWVLAAAVAAGGDALRIHSLRAEVSDPGTALKAARESAFADARSKAAHLAALAGARLGAALLIREVGDAPVEPLQRAKAVALAAESMPVVAGRRELSVTLEVQWELLTRDSGPAAGS